MKGFNILYVAMWRIFTNLDVAFRVSVFWGTILGASWIVSSIATFQAISAASDPTATSSFVVLIFVVGFTSMIAAVFGGSTVAISWHRFCILGENSQRIVFWPKKGLMWKYIKAVFVLMLVLFLLMLPVALILMPLLFSSFSSVGEISMTFQVTNFVVNVVLGSFVAGFSLFLPAAAIGKPVSFSQIVDLIRAEFLVLLSLSFAYSFLQLAFSWLTRNVSMARFPVDLGFSYLLFLPVLMLVSWFFIMLSIGYISELYGTYFVDDSEVGNGYAELTD